MINILKNKFKKKFFNNIADLKKSQLHPILIDLNDFDSLFILLSIFELKHNFILNVVA